MQARHEPSHNSISSADPSELGKANRPVSISNGDILQAIAAEWGERLDSFSYAQKTEALFVLSHLVHTHSLAEVQSDLLPRKFLLIINQLTVDGLLTLAIAICHQLRVCQP